MPSKEILDRLISMEWKMFSSVNEGGPKADCQQDPVTFDGMRRAQFSAWSDEAVMSYLNDVENAAAIGRNLAMEKYIHMMKNNQPEQYAVLIKRVAFPSDKAVELAEKIAAEMIAQTIPLHRDFPYVSGAGRPLYSTEDYKGFISVETYQKGELYTYSLNTLKALWNHLNELKQNGISLARVILENSVKHYGYQSLEQAEQFMADYSRRRK